MSKHLFLRLFHEPFSGLTHLGGAAAGIIGLAYLMLAKPADHDWSKIAFAIYGLSFIGLYLASAAYHLLRVSVAARLRLRRLDHAMIAVFIAGTYTPYCLIALHNEMGFAVLAVVWGLAALGLVRTFIWLQAPRWVSTLLYLLMGWIGLVVAYPLSQTLSHWGLVLVVSGGICYSIGALVYASKRPNPWPPVFGFHEIWHLFVLGGSACHFASIMTLA